MKQTFNVYTKQNPTGTTTIKMIPDSKCDIALIRDKDYILTGTIKE